MAGHYSKITMRQFVAKVTGHHFTPRRRGSFYKQLILTGRLDHLSPQIGGIIATGQGVA
jgi:hypothetical protein